MWQKVSSYKTRNLPFTAISSKLFEFFTRERIIEEPRTFSEVSSYKHSMYLSILLIVGFSGISFNTKELC